MDAALNLNQSLRTEQTLSPQMLQSLALLPMPILELKAHIQAEIESNPALEIPDSEYDLSLILYDDGIITAIAIKIPEGTDIHDAIEYFKKIKGVTAVHRDYIYHLIDPVEPKLEVM